MSESTPSTARPTDPVGRVLYFVARALAIFGGFVFTAVAVMMTVSVLSRWLFSMPVRGDFELMEIGAGIATFSFLPYCQLMRENIVVDFFLANASVRTKAIYDALGSLAFGAVIVLVTWRTALGGFDMHANRERTTMLEIELWWSFPWAVACLAFLAVVCVYTLARNLREARLNASL